MISFTVISFKLQVELTVSLLKRSKNAFINDSIGLLGCFIDFKLNRSSYQNYVWSDLDSSFSFTSTSGFTSTELTYSVTILVPRLPASCDSLISIIGLDIDMLGCWGFSLF